MVDLLVNPFLCLNDEDVVLPNKKAPKGRGRRAKRYFFRILRGAYTAIAILVSP